MDPASYPIILTYHSISSGHLPTQIPASLFCEQMRWVAANACVVRLGEVVLALRNRTALPERAVVLTFDDGYRDFYLCAAPVLRSLKLPATIFLPTGFRGANRESRNSHESWTPEAPLLGWEQVSELVDDGFEFGAHSITHTDLTTLTPERARREIRDSKFELQDRTGRRAEFFAYPYGCWNRAVRAMVAEEYRAACSTGAGVVQPDCDPLALPRVDAHYLRRPASLRMMFTSRFLAYVATRRFIRRVRRQPEGLYATL